MLMKLRNFEEALEIFERVMEINPLLAEGSLDESMRICKASISNPSSDSNRASEEAYGYAI